jgi:hypothetical protein
LGFESWQAFYASDAQGVYALLPVPALFLAWWLAAGPRPRAQADPVQRFAALWAPLFALETLLDPLVSGLLARALGLEGAAALALVIPFVLLGDFRIYWLLFALGDPAVDAARSARRAAQFTFAVPFAAVAIFYGGVRSLAPDAPGQGIWLVYELAFCAMLIGLRRRWLDARAAQVPDRARMMRAILDYALLYYALWAACDAAILSCSLDLAWALRAVPNQLYYSFTVPFVCWLIGRSARREATCGSPGSSSRGTAGS